MPCKYTDTMIRGFIQVLFALTWGFAGIGKLLGGVQTPAWFVEKFQATFLNTFPGLFLSYVGVMTLELSSFLVILISLFRAEFLQTRKPLFLQGGLLLSLGTFISLLFGLQLTGDHDGVANLFQYFGVTLICLLWLDFSQNRRD